MCLLVRLRSTERVREIAAVLQLEIAPVSASAAGPSSVTALLPVVPVGFLFRRTEGGQKNRTGLKVNATKDNRFFKSMVSHWNFQLPHSRFRGCVCGNGRCRSNSFLKRCKKISLNTYHASGIAIWASVAGLIGARVFYLVQNFGYTLKHPETVFEINGATVSFGVYLGGIAGVILYSRLYKVVPWKYLDVGVSVLGLGPMIGRIACFLNGDDYGTVSTVPWAGPFRHGSYPFIDHVERGWITPMDDLSLPVHPVQLYGCVKGLALFVSVLGPVEEKSLQARSIVFPVLDVLFLFPVYS